MLVVEPKEQFCIQWHLSETRPKPHKRILVKTAWPMQHKSNQPCDTGHYIDLLRNIIFKMPTSKQIYPVAYVHIYM